MRSSDGKPLSAAAAGRRDTGNAAALTPTEEPLRILSLGAGVQSTALLMLVLDGEVQADAAIFADTGWEPAAVYAHLEQLRVLAAMRGFPVYVVSNGNIRNTASQTDFYDAPYYLRNPDGSDGMSRRQCTHQLKIVPIRRKTRELMAARGLKPTPGVVECLSSNPGYCFACAGWQRLDERTKDRKLVVYHLPSELHPAPEPAPLAPRHSSQLALEGT